MARMQGKTTSEHVQCFAGVDVSKAYLDLHVQDTGRARRFCNDPDGIAALLRALGQAPHLVALEPTGRYHLGVWRALEATGHAVAPIHPLAARRLAEGMGALAKTDAIDARVLARIAARLRPCPVRAPDEITQEIKALYALRRSLIKRRAIARTQAREAEQPLIARLLAEEIDAQSLRIKQLEAALLERIRSQPGPARAYVILTSIPGIGRGAAIAILADLPEIGRATPAEVAALTGCAPMTRESGSWKGRSRTRGGRRRLRTALHMPALVAMSHNPDLAAFARRLKARGKNGAIIITAVLRKLIILANALVAQNREWTPKHT